MEINIKIDKKMIVETANRVLDEYEYNGKTIREWADLIANPKTNADRIRSMTDEELAKFLYEETDYPKEEYWLKWLKEEASVDGLHKADTKADSP